MLRHVMGILLDASLRFFNLKIYRGIVDLHVSFKYITEIQNFYRLYFI